MTRHAVCYIASDGYLFQTVVSALQARANLHESAAVYVISLVTSEEVSAEQQLFADICETNGVVFRREPMALMEGFSPTYGRLFVDRFLPDEIEEILYLDGDTQITGPIDELMFAEPPVSGAIGVRDPMVFIQASVASLGTKIDSWWDQSELSEQIRARYINAGVLRLSRSYVPELRAKALQIHSERGSTIRFADQDLVNLVLEDRVEVVSMRWNFPGFLLSSQVAELAEPRIIHFMSSPRPWNAPLWPWGRAYYDPYAEFAARYPESAIYWPRVTGLRWLRYVAQQAYKRATEAPKWRTPAVAAAVQKLASNDRTLA
jgi:lipopolysaccharide biosynthesis glycosyltransferase